MATAPAVKILNRHPQAQVFCERDDVQLLALLAHGLHLSGAVGGHVDVQAVRQEREEPVPVQAQITCVVDINV